MKAYAAYYDENEIRIGSSSGGVFTAIARQFNISYGVAMTEDCYGCKFVRVEENIEPLRGSKYLQASLGDTYKQVKKDLDGGKKVLFSGTGCQINGLSMYLGKEYNNLLLLDIVCHGVPSPKLWKKYVQFREKKYGKLKKIYFRSKEEIDKSKKEGNKFYISKDKDPFMKLFLENYCLRPACYECQAKFYKKSDISIADFWGIEKIEPEMDDGMGVNLVITRTRKGQKLFDLIKENLNYKEVRYEDGVRYNSAEYQSALYPTQRKDFFTDLNNMAFTKILNKYIYGPLWKRMGRKIKNIVRILLPKRKIKKRKNTDYGMLFVFKK